VTVIPDHVLDLSIFELPLALPSVFNLGLDCKQLRQPKWGYLGQRQPNVHVMLFAGRSGETARLGLNICAGDGGSAVR
jgi:hypothetical protein